MSNVIAKANRVANRIVESAARDCPVLIAVFTDDGSRRLTIDLLPPIEQPTKVRRIRVARRKTRECRQGAPIARIEALTAFYACAMASGAELSPFNA